MDQGEVQQCAVVEDLGFQLVREQLFMVAYVRLIHRAFSNDFYDDVCIRFNVWSILL